MVSIVMPAYNAEKTIEASIESVISQSYQEWELIVVDDGSSDATPQIAEAFSKKDPRIRFHVNEKNIGVAQTRNYAVSRAQCQYIAFLDSDDLWHKDKLTKQLQLMEATGAAISYTATAYINSTGNISSCVLPAEPELCYKTLLKRNIMSCSSVIVRRNTIADFPKGKNIHEDYALWLKILRKTGKAHGLNEPLLIYRISKSSKSAARFRSAKMIYNAYRHTGYSVLSATFLTLRYFLHSISKRSRINAGWREA